MEYVSPQIIGPATIEPVKLSGAPFLTVKQFCEQFGWPSEPALRAYIFRAHELGLESAFIRIGRRVLIDPIRLFALIKELSEEPRCLNKPVEKYASAHLYRR